MIALLYLTTFALATVQAADSSLLAAVAQLPQAELRGGGWRDTLVWRPYDATSADVLRRMPLRPGDTVVGIGDERPLCPGGTDSTGTLIPQPVGFSFRAQIHMRGADSATVQLDVYCRFLHRGRARGFGQGKTWDAAKLRGQWTMLRVVKMWVT